MMTMKDFVAKYKGKAVDIDKAFGVQCVDGAKLWFKEQGFKNYLLMGYCTGNGYASNLWTGPSKALTDNCTRITGAKNFRDGDVVIWGKTSQTPLTHVAIYYQGKAFGQNQGGKNGGFNLVSLNMDKALGAWRVKGYKTQLEVDGIFDKDCVKALQKYLSQYEDGYIGNQRQKWAKYHPNLKSVEYKGSGYSKTVKALQQTLNASGFKMGIDGQWGPKTSGNLQKYLTAKGFPVGTDQIFGPKTAKQLQKLLNKAVF